MKNSTFAKTALSTLIALSLTACSHKFADNDHTATQSVIKQDTTALNEALTAKEKAETAKAEAEKAKEKALADKADADKKVKELEAKIDELKKKGGDSANNTDLQKELEKAQAQAKTAEENLKTAEDKLAKAPKQEDLDKLKKLDKDFEKKSYSVSYIAKKVATPSTDREKTEAFFRDESKFKFEQVFGDEDAYHNGSKGLLKGDIEVNGRTINFNRFDLEHSKIANMWTAKSATDSTQTNVLAYAGKPTDLTKLSFDELKGLNDGVLTYKGRAFIGVHKIKEQKRRSCGRACNWGYELGPVKALDKVTTKDASANFTVDLAGGTMSGTLTSDSYTTSPIPNSTERKKTYDVVVDLGSAKIEPENDQLVFKGEGVTITADYADASKKGTYEGKFMGPRAEELAGKFDFAQTHTKYSKDGDYAHIAGAYDEYGDIQGVFNARKQGKDKDSFKLEK